MPKSRRPRGFQHYESQHFRLDQPPNLLWLKADTRGLFSVHSVQSLWSGFCTILLGPRPDDSMINGTVISTRGITTLSNTVKVASCLCFSTILTTLSTTFLTLSSYLLSMNWFWHAHFSLTIVLPKKIKRLLVWSFKVSSRIALALVILPMKKTFKDPFNWPSCFLC